MSNDINCFTRLLISFGVDICVNVESNKKDAEHDMNDLKIDLEREFPNLPNAPIVEAIVHWQAPATVALVEGAIEAQLQEFADYRTRLQYNEEVGLTGSADGFEVKQSRNWQGARLSKPEETKPEFVCQFLKNGIVFSRLAPYVGWGNFASEANKFWSKYIEIAKPANVSQLSVRYISQIPVRTLDQVGEFIDQVCAPLGDLGLSAGHFFHQDTIQLNNHPYRINLIRAVQPATGSSNTLIVDISVSTTTDLEDLGQVDDKLNELRFIKNEVFFTLMKEAETKFGAV